MNQIGGISEFRVNRNKELLVQMPDSQWYANDIYLYCIPRIRGNDKEIILSHIDPSEWRYIWELSFNVTQDKPGIIYKTTKILRELEINICKTEGVTPSEDIDFSIWFFVNIKHFADKNGVNWKDMEMIESKLTESIQEKLSSEDLEYLEIKEIAPNEFLFENYINVAKERVLNKVDDLLDYFEHPIGFSLTNNKGKIDTTKIFNSLKIENNSQKHYCTVLSDLTQTNYFILRFFEAHQKIVFVDIMHRHTIGAINELAHIIFKESDGKYNLLYNRATVKKDKGNEQDRGNACHWYTLIDITANETRCNQIFAHIENCQMSWQKGSVKVLRYTNNLSNAIDKNFKILWWELAIANLKNNKNSLLVFISILLSFGWFILLLYKHNFNFESLRTELKNDSIIALIIGPLLYIFFLGGAMKDSLEFFKNLLARR